MARDYRKENHTASSNVWPIEMLKCILAKIQIIITTWLQEKMCSYSIYNIIFLPFLNFHSHFIPTCSNFSQVGRNQRKAISDWKSQSWMCLRS